LSSFFLPSFTLEKMRDTVEAGSAPPAMPRSCAQATSCSWLMPLGLPWAKVSKDVLSAALMSAISVGDTCEIFLESIALERRR
jgi:hypothetical protein